MKRSDFIKSSGLAFAGISLGFVNPINAKDESFGQFKIDQSDFRTPLEIDCIDESSELFWGWLGRLFVSALVTNLVAEVVDYMVPDPVCTGDSCPKRIATYSNPNGIYGYQSTSPRFYKQDIDDRRTNFQNVSVPFISYVESDCGAEYKEIIKVEGPYLAGLCHLTKDLRRKYSIKDVRRVVVPKKQITNAGYRFDTGDCDGNTKTKFKSNYGKTELDYSPKTRYVNAKVYDRYDNLDFNKSYLV